MCYLEVGNPSYKAQSIKWEKQLRAFRNRSKTNTDNLNPWLCQTYVPLHAFSSFLLSLSKDHRTKLMKRWLSDSSPAVHLHETSCPQRVNLSVPFPAP